jgi:CAAX protease family protein
MGWKALLFVSMVAALYLAAQPLLNQVAPRPRAGSISLRTELIRKFCFVLLVLAATGVMARLERRPVRSYGYTDATGPRRLLIGACWGFVSISALVGALWLHGSLVFDAASAGSRKVFLYAVASVLGSLMVGLLEESLLRGYLQFTLARALGFWWAALILSVAFGLLHAGNAGETPLGLLGAGAGGLLFCLSLWYTKSLFWAVGFHTGFGWGESYFYGTANSGQVIPWSMLASRATGDPLLSGGSAGPEGSVLLLPLLLALLVGMCVWWGRGKPVLGLREQWPSSL